MDPIVPPIPPSDSAALLSVQPPSITSLLHTRFNAGQFYTAAGSSTLIAVNPLTPPPLTNDPPEEKVEMRAPAPHPFALAERVYKTMLSERADQSIVMTGESGSGKTEISKSIIDFLALKSTEAERLASLTRHANVLLDAFGCVDNGRTNSNASRYEKVVKLKFTEEGQLAGLSVDAFALEDTRVASRAPSERNFHIFYQLLAGCSTEELRDLYLTPSPSSSSYDSFNYTTYTPLRAPLPTSATLSLIGALRTPDSYLSVLPKEVLSACVSHVGDDAMAFRRTNEALEAFGVTPQERKQIYAILAAILHLGNIEFKEVLDKTVIVNAPVLDKVGRLLGVPDNMPLEPALLTPRIMAGREAVTITLSSAAAESSRNALATNLYARLFMWLVAHLNAALNSKSDLTKGNTITIVDFAGFLTPTSSHSSLAQLLYNYASERAQHAITFAVLWGEQEEYAREKLVWNFIDFGVALFDLALLDKNPIGIFALLEEESLFPRGTDATFIKKIGAHARNPNFKLSESITPKTFTIKHTSGSADYTAEGWLHQNRAPLQSDLVLCMRSSSLALVCKYFESEYHGFLSGRKEQSKNTRGASFITRVGFFKENLTSVINALDTTTLHSVRCIIPNRENQSANFVADVVQSQVECAHVCEALVMLRKGYPIWMLTAEFTRRCARPEEEEKEEARARLLERFLDANEIQFGTTKVFFKQGAYEELFAATPVNS